MSLYVTQDIGRNAYQHGGKSKAPRHGESDYYYYNTSAPAEKKGTLPKDDIWEGIVSAKDQLLNTKDTELIDLRENLSRQKALIQKLRGNNSGYRGNRSYAFDPTSESKGQQDLHSKHAYQQPHQRITEDKKVIETPKTTMLAGPKAMYTVKQEYEALVQSRDEQVRIMEQELKKTNSKLRDVQLHASALEDDLATQRRYATDQKREVETQLTREIMSLKTELEEKNFELAQVYRRERTLQESNDNYLRKFESMEKYVSQLPTMEEFNEENSGRIYLEQECAGLKQRAVEAEAEVDNLTLALRNSEQEKSELRNACADLQAKHNEELSSGKTTTDEVKKANGILQDNLASKQEIIESLQTEIDMHRHARAEAEEKLENIQLMRDEADAGHKQRDRQLTELRETLQKYQDSINDYRLDIRKQMDIKETMEKKLNAQAGTIRDLRKALESMRSVNQSLLESTYSDGGVFPSKSKRTGVQPGGEEDLTLSMSSASIVANSHQMDPLDRVQEEMAECILSLRAVVDVAIARASGRYVDIGKLLGTRKDDDVYAKVSDPAQRLPFIREMQKDVDDLRDHLSDRFAEDVGFEACEVQ
eukprot:m.142902 g.142902  ORF g.142902 m.142902 type:complete len:591 (+) comp14890_c0_seq5:186-1958(+)